MRCKPITIKEVIGGQRYIRVGVTMDGQLWITSLVFCGRPFNKKWKTINGSSAWIQVKKKTSNWTYLSDIGEKSCVSVEDCGLDPKRRLTRGRTFRFNGRNQAILEDLVAQQDIAGYLKLIGIQDPQSTIEMMEAEYKDFMSFCQDQDDEEAKLEAAGLI